MRRSRAVIHVWKSGRRVAVGVERRRPNRRAASSASRWRSSPGLQSVNSGKHVQCRPRHGVALDRLRATPTSCVGDGSQQLGDPVDPARRVEVAADQVREAGRLDVVVGRGDPAALGIPLGGKLRSRGSSPSTRARRPSPGRVGCRRLVHGRGGGRCTGTRCARRRRRTRSSGPGSAPAARPPRTLARRSRSRPRVRATDEASRRGRSSGARTCDRSGGSASARAPATPCVRIGPCRVSRTSTHAGLRLAPHDDRSRRGR